MNPIAALTPILEGIPALVRRFLFKALLIFVGWKLLYHLVLVPIRFPDRPLTNVTATSTAAVYSMISGNPVRIVKADETANNYNSTTLFIGDNKIVGIADPCNGLELYVLYLGFLVCIPSSNQKKVFYSVIGVLGIYVLNILRCSGIAWLNINMVSLSNFAHHYLFKTIIYGLIFLTWIKFSKDYFKSAT